MGAGLSRNQQTSFGERTTARSRQTTNRDQDVIALVAEGLTNREVGERLGLSEGIVKNYLRVIYDKLGVWNRVELALWYEAHKTPTKTQKENR